MKSAVVVWTLLVLVAALTCSQATFSATLKSYLKSLLEHHEVQPFSAAILCSPNPRLVRVRTPHEEINYPNEDDYLLPGVIIWDPSVQHCIQLQLQSLLCFEHECNQKLHFVSWQDGSIQRYEPRSIYGMNGLVLLVCQIFRCPAGHFITTCDPRFLAQFCDKISVPFVLFHKSGVTREVYDIIFDLASHGLSFRDIEVTLGWRQQEQQIAALLSFHQDLKYSEISTGTVAEPIYARHISNDLLVSCFISKYNELKDFLTHSMLNIKGTCFSCDHTFKLAKHIGMMRDGHWVPQYDTVFIMMNEIGQVVFWQLTMGTSFGAVQEGLQCLNARMEIAKSRVEMICIDNCCLWRKKIEGTFGDHVLVKLDLFHAVSRLARAMSKKHPLHWHCLQDFRLVFRSSGDNGPKRMLSTPDPDILLANVEAFISKWSKIEFDGSTILNTAACGELDRLKKHLESGCLSGIPAGFGTNRNENLHRSLNGRLAGHRLGVQLAVSLLGTFFYVWNAKHCDNYMSPTAAFLRDKLTRLLSDDPSTISSVDEQKFGIGISSGRRHCEYSLGTSFKRKFKPTDLLQTVWSIEEKFVSDDTNSHICKILCFALTSMHTFTKVRELSKTHAALQFSQTPLPTVESVNEADIHSKRLRNVLQSFQMETFDVPGDGDCLFTSIATHFRTCDIGDALKEHIATIGISLQMTTSEIVSTLRALLVEEWLQNESEYNAYFPNCTNFEEEATKYADPGVYSTELGDAMLMALANILCTPLVVFTSVESWPYLSIQPRHPIEPEPIYLALMQVGPGHYCPAFPKPVSPAPTAPTEIHETAVVEGTNFCRCGQGVKKKRREIKNCSAKSDYSSRCPCLKMQLPCGSKCKCLSCDNHYGQHQACAATTCTQRRKRPRHQHQENRLPAPKFMKDSNEQPHVGGWSELETQVLLATVHFILGPSILDDDETNVQEIVEVYNDVVTFVDSDTDLPLPLSRKSFKQVQAKLGHCKKERKIQQICGLVNYPAV